MTPVEVLQAQVAELMAWKRAREIQQISYPVDDASRNALGVVVGSGPGNSNLEATTTLNLTGLAQTINLDLPAPYAGTRIVRIEGQRFEIPYLSQS